MAKKSRREPDPDLEEEELELQDEDEPPRKKKGDSAKLGKSSTGKRKSVEKNNTSSVKKSLKDSGKRKTATGSARRPSASDDEDEVTSSSARRRRMPAPKKKDNTVVLISIVTMTVLLIGGVLVVRSSQKPKENRNEQVEYDGFKKLWDEGNNYFREFNAAEKAGNAALAQQKHKAAHQKLTAAVDALEKILADKRGPDGMLPKEFEGYEEDLQKIALLIVDLEKRGTLNRND